MMAIYPNKKGFGLVEVVVSLSITAVLAVSFITLLVHSESLSRHNLDVLKAELYATEAVEQVRELERSSFAELDTSLCEHPAGCHIEEVSGAWAVVMGEETLDTNFERVLNIEKVYRNQLAFPNEIVASGGVLDPDTKLVYVVVEWNNTKGAHQKDIEIYVHEQ
jgi:prepilin-type N-terminal cleavage/methylation domain-containing protein